MKRAAWILVVAVALGLSNWSLAYVARQWGVPWLLPWLVSAVFDGVALICAGLALRAARGGDSTFAPSAALVIFGGASAFFNAWHARLAGLPWAAAAFYAFPPLAAVTVTELHLRADQRESRREHGRIADPLPAFGGATWLHHGYRSWIAQREITAHRLQAKLNVATGKPAAQRVTKTADADGPETVAGPARPRRSTGHRTHTRLSPEDLAQMAKRLREDEARGLPITRRKVAAAYGLTPHNAQLSINAMSNGSAS